MLHRQLSSHLTKTSLEGWLPKFERNLGRLRDGVRGPVYLRNVQRWTDLIEHRDVVGLHRVMTGLDRASIEMREVSPFGGLLPENERLGILRELRAQADASRPARTCDQDRLQIIGRPEVIIVGSQSILGTYSEGELPALTTASMEIDVLPIADTNEETAGLADEIEGVAGEFSPCEDICGFSIDGVDLEPSALPAGWRDRLVKVQNANTAAPSGEPVFTGWCLEKEDVCVAKLCAFREKDRDFVGALIRAELVGRPLNAERLSTVSERYGTVADQALEWLAAW